MTNFNEISAENSRLMKVVLELLKVTRNEKSDIGTVRHKLPLTFCILYQRGPSTSRKLLDLDL